MRNESSLHQIERPLDFAQNKHRLHFSSRLAALNRDDFEQDHPPLFLIPLALSFDCTTVMDGRNAFCLCCLIIIAFPPRR